MPIERSRPRRTHAPTERLPRGIEGDDVERLSSGVGRFAYAGTLSKATKADWTTKPDWQE